MNSDAHSRSGGMSRADFDPMHARFVPLHDTPGDHPIYSPMMVIMALLGAATGAVLFGWLAWAIAEGGLPVAGLGQFAAAGWGVATFTGAGVGAALGGLAGGVIALFRIPPAHSRERHRAHPH